MVPVVLVVAAKVTQGWAGRLELSELITWTNPILLMCHMCVYIYIYAYIYIISFFAHGPQLTVLKPPDQD